VPTETSFERLVFLNRIEEGAIPGEKKNDERQIYEKVLDWMEKKRNE
jgi:hypothetical protein